MRHVHTEKHDDVIVVRPLEDLVGGSETTALADCVRERTEHGTPCVILDLGSVGFMNSLALGTIVAVHVSLTKRELCLMLCNLDDRIRKLLEVTKLDSVLQHCEDVDAALARWSALRPPTRTA